ncbi:MAG: PepSY domain-containing protein [Novosphingobium sp.]|uniref:PepSY domain-containing protein n=1 Tax=Novosphingobium sp. TaxID=1874826 RepID=UPI0032BE7F86
MAKLTPMQNLARWHIWLGWLVAIPLLLWIISGVFMTLRPIEDVRGGDLRREPAPFAPQVLIAPRLDAPATRVMLVPQGPRAVWAVTGADKVQSRYSADSGTLLGPVGVTEARVLAELAYAGSARLTAIRRFTADQAPLDLRRPRPSWQAAFEDGTHIYIDAETGEVLALRTKWWRAYDFMWGLHIMDPAGREDTSHPLLWLLGGLSLITSLFGTALLLRRRKAAR